MAKSFKRTLLNFAAKIYFKLKKDGLAQALHAGSEGGEAPFDTALLRRAAAEGAVLLKNGGALPVVGQFAVFGRTQTDLFYTGYGSGGDVKEAYHVSVLDALKAAKAPYDGEVAAFYEAEAKAHPVDRGGWGEWELANPEPLPPQSLVAAAAARCETAVVVLGRSAGEDRDVEPVAGEYYLSKGEAALLGAVKGHFRRVAVVLNTGNFCDLSWTEDPAIDAVLFAFLGGMEAGNAIADLILGKVSPAGKLPDTVARSYRAHPAAKNFGTPRRCEYREGLFVGYRHFETYAPADVLYPFGFGLSYTTFALTASYEDGALCYRVENTGVRAGKTAVEVYVKKPRSAPSRELVGFCKTALLAPQGAEAGKIPLSLRELSVCRAEECAFVLEKGTYEIYAGFDVRSADMVASFFVSEDKVVETFTDILHCDLKSAVERALPAPLEKRGDFTFEDVQKGRCTPEEFAAALSPEALADLSRGALKMDSPLGAKGNAGVMGGVSEELRRAGVPPVTMTDGPSGVRLAAVTALIPCATLLAATFDEALVSEVYALVGGELARLNSDVLLAPGLNLHRHPLCGRNFEYFSEDPYLSGKIAAAAVRGVQKNGRAACPKHFACNNQEFNRNKLDVRVAEEPLRELYLRAFEIAVKEGKPKFLMTSYNLVNGVYSHYNYALVRGVLRGEWGFTGCVVTDWWMRKGKSPHFRHIKNNAYRVRAGVNVLMPGGAYVGSKPQHGSALVGFGKKEGITLGELQQNAAEIVRTVADLKREEEE